MSLNGIDISNWQAGIDLTAVPADFVIAKATQGTGYVSPDCARQVEQARATGKRFGVYHYVSGGNAVAEANHFVDSCANWVGKGLFCIDWESQENSAWGDEGYLEQVVAQVKARTGIPPLILLRSLRSPIVRTVVCGSRSMRIKSLPDIRTLRGMKALTLASFASILPPVAFRAMAAIWI